MIAGYRIHTRFNWAAFKVLYMLLITAIFYAIKMFLSVSNEIVIKCVQADIKFQNALVLSLLVKESSGKDIVRASLWLFQPISYANIKLATLPILQCQHSSGLTSFSVSQKKKHHCASTGTHTHTCIEQAMERGDKERKEGLQCGRVGETQTTGERRGKWAGKQRCRKQDRKERVRGGESRGGEERKDVKGELKVQRNIRKHVQPSGAKWAARRKGRIKERKEVRGKSVLQVWKIETKGEKKKGRMVEGGRRFQYTARL